MGILSLFKKKEKPEDILRYVNKNRGILWEKIEEFSNQLNATGGFVTSGTDEMEEQFPTKHHFSDGLYTREVFMPKGSLVVSFIHKQSHPSFFMEGEMSILTDAGEIKKIKAPMTIQTEIGTQRVAYMHEDVRWSCVYKTDKKNIKDAMKEIYTLDYRELPSSLIIKHLELCQD
jgi:hypothetical protein